MHIWLKKQDSMTISFFAIHRCRIQKETQPWVFEYYTSFNELNNFQTELIR